MDAIPEMELSRDQLLALLRQRDEEVARLQRELAKLQQQLDRLTAKSPAPRVDESFSMAAEERRRAKKSQKKPTQKSPRRGRHKTEDKLDRAERRVAVLPEGFTLAQCKLAYERPAWRIEDGRAVLVAYEIYRGPGGEKGSIPGVMANTEFGTEIYVTLAFMLYILGLSMDKVVELFTFFWQLNISKSQADALLNRLSREWHAEFDAICELLAISAVVHADETSWSINSVWALLSEQVRVLVFGCKKDAATLDILLPKQVFDGILVSDDAAVYRDFTKSQKCWAHLLRKAIKLTLLDPENAEYRRFLDGLLEVYRTACRSAKEQCLDDAEREQRLHELDDMLCDVCGPRFADEIVPTTAVEKDYYLLVHELVRLLGDEELFTFVRYPEASGTNNEAERTLRQPAMDRRTGRTSKTLPGARRRTVIVSVLESLRFYMPRFTLQSVVAEVSTWVGEQSGRFQQMLKALNRGPPETSPLDRLLPLPPK